jgi:hypothetical protein
MRLTIEAIIRGEVMTLELSERDFCPECCGTLEVGGTEAKPFLRCSSCYLIMKPKAKQSEESCQT